MKTLPLRCYCCGEPLGAEFDLVVISPGATDRVFMMRVDHTDRLAEGTTVRVRALGPARVKRRTRKPRRPA